MESCDSEKKEQIEATAAHWIIWFLCKEQEIFTEIILKIGYLFHRYMALQQKDDVVIFVIIADIKKHSWDTNPGGQIN